MEYTTDSLFSLLCNAETSRAATEDMSSKLADVSTSCELTDARTSSELADADNPSEPASIPSKQINQSVDNSSEPISTMPEQLFPLIDQAPKNTTEKSPKKAAKKAPEPANHTSPDVSAQAFIAHYRSPITETPVVGSFEFTSEYRASSKYNLRDARIRMLELFGKDAVSWTIDKVERKSKGNERLSSQGEIDFREPKQARSRRHSRKYL